MSQDPMMTHLKTQLHSKRSQGDSAMLASGGSSARSVDLGSFPSQGSVQFEDLEILRPCGEGSFGKVSCRGSAECRCRRCRRSRCRRFGRSGHSLPLLLLSL
jgi:hypothetical protein